MQDSVRAQAVFKKLGFNVWCHDNPTYKDIEHVVQSMYTSIASYFPILTHINTFTPTPYMLKGFDRPFL